MARFVISYRREDTQHFAGRIHDRLAGKFGADDVFMDIDAIDPGDDFTEAIDRALESAVALVAIIGPGWLDARDDGGNRRLENPADFVRLEIATALDRDIRVIPLLAEDARMPSADELPDDLRALSTRQAISIRHDRFHADASELVEALEVVSQAIENDAPPEILEFDRSFADRARLGEDLAAPQPDPGPRREFDAPAPVAASEDRPSSARANYALFVLVIVYAINFIDRNILTTLIEPIKQELGVSDTAMGLLTGLAFAVFYTFAGIPIAQLADRGSRRTVMSIGIAFWSLMTAVSGLATSYAQLALARIGVGVGEASATPAAHSLISDYFPPERRTRAIAIYNTGASLGVLFGLALGGWLASEFGWRFAFMAVGLPGLLVALLVRFTIAEPERGRVEGLADRGERPGVKETLRHLLGMKSFRHIALAAALYSMTAYGVLAWAFVLMIRVHDVSAASLGLQLGLVIGIGGAVGQVLGGILCDRLALRDRRWLVWVPAILAVAHAPFYVVFALATSPGLALLAFVPVNLMNAVFAAPTYTLTQGLATLRMRATGSAIVLFVLNLIGLGLGPTLVGVLNDVFAASYGDEAIRTSLLFLLVASLWGAVHSVLASRTVAADLDRAAALERG